MRDEFVLDLLLFCFFTIMTYTFFDLITVLKRKIDHQLSFAEWRPNDGRSPNLAGLTPDRDKVFTRNLPHVQKQSLARIF